MASHHQHHHPDLPSGLPLPPDLIKPELDPKHHPKRASSPPSSDHHHLQHQQQQPSNHTSIGPPHPPRLVLQDDTDQPNASLLSPSILIDPSTTPASNHSHSPPQRPVSSPPRRLHIQPPQQAVRSDSNHPNRPPILLPSSSSSSSSSLSSPSSSNSNSGQARPPTNHQSRDRVRTDSFFGLDKLDQFIQSPSSDLPQPPFPTHRGSHPQGSLKVDTQAINSIRTFDSGLRPSSFYGLPLDPSLERPYDHPNNHYRSSGSDSLASSLPSDPTDLRHRSLNPALLARSTQRRHSSRLSSIPHPQDSLLSDPNNLIPAGPLLDHSHLKPGHKAKLLNHAKTLELYRANAKKTNDPEVMFEFGCFLMDLVKEMGAEDDEACSPLGAQIDLPEVQRRKSIVDQSKTPNVEKEKEKAALTQEALFLLQKLANRGHVQSQFLLADCYTKGIGPGPGLSSTGIQQLGSSPVTEPTGPTSRKGSKQDFERAFPLFVLAAKHGHVEAMYRAGQCCEYGWGTRKERDKALQFYRKAAIAQHPLAMYRLSLADLNGDLGYPRRPKDGVKWLKRAAESADASHPNSLHELALLHERGLEHVVFVDYDYAVELLARAAELGYAPSAYKLGECYEYGRLGCPQDAALSIHYYNIAAQQGHKEACFALTAWYLVGSPGVLPQSDTEAYLWAKKAAEAGLAKAEYAVGYFTEVGVGTTRDEREAMRWFKRAAERGDKRAKDRLKNDAAGVTSELNANQTANNQTKNASKRKTRSNFGGARANGGGADENKASTNYPLPTSTQANQHLASSTSASGENKKGKEECVIV